MIIGSRLMPWPIQCTAHAVFTHRRATQTSSATYFRHIPELRDEMTCPFETCLPLFIWVKQFKQMLTINLTQVAAYGGYCEQQGIQVNSLERHGNKSHRSSLVLKSTPADGCELYKCTDLKLRKHQQPSTNKEVIISVQVRVVSLCHIYVLTTDWG